MREYTHLYPAVHTWPHFDVLQLITYHWADLQLPLEIFHVKSHQDEKNPYEDLTRPAQMNCKAHKLATRALKAHLQTPYKPPHPAPNCNAYLRHKKDYVCSHEFTFLRNKKAIAEINEYYKDRFQWTENTKNKIDWKAFEAINKRPPTPRHYQIKNCCGWLPTNQKIQQTIDLTHQPTCPYCQEVETQDHLYQCPSQHKW